MPRLAILFFCAFTILTCPVIVVHAQKTERSMLEGTWQVTKLVDESGKPAPGKEIKDLTFEFKDEILTIRKDKNDPGLKGKFSVEASKMPKWVNFDVAPFGTTLGIYKLDSDVLSICLGPDFKSEKSARPTEFKAGMTSALFELKRLKK